MSYARKNNATEASIDISRIYSSGTFKNVWAGTYIAGARKGQRCVSKEFKTGSVVEDHYFKEELKICRQAQKIIDKFNHAAIIDREIQLNKPQIWTYDANGHRALVEPMIQNFERFNSNSGWASTDTSAMQALSHFSYHNSNGQSLLCDLQGGIYPKGYVLTDPVIMSQDGKCGPADLGAEGISEFFRRHRCGRFCSRNWLKPAGLAKADIPMRVGTTMAAYLPTRRSRNTLSRRRGGY